jgi:NitT/TauT family transport system ATP-binding protein
MPLLTVANLNKKYTRPGSHDQIIFDDFSLSLPENKIIVIVGPNGCGKTTLLNCIAGLTPSDGGTIRINKKDDATAIGFVFQNYRESMLPWLSNIDNIACTLERPHFTKFQKQLYIKQWATAHNIVLPWDAYPYECSGGQQQLIVLVREFINQPAVLLMDEPFAALDYEKRLAWHQQLLALWEKSPTTIILVSHDIEEAIYLADEVIVLGNIPTKIIGHHHIDIPRPRTPTTLQDEAFFRLHRVVLQSFMRASAIL